MSNEPFVIIRPDTIRYPILISVPHCGTMIPATELSLYREKLATAVADTDWRVHELYGFAQKAGIMMVHAVYSRYVIDLNRDPEGGRLYADSRQETGLLPLKTSHGEDLYKDPSVVTDELRQRRVAQYYQPYYQAVRNLLRELKTQFKHVLFFDAHSIKRYVPTIRPDPFPDLILGNQDGKTADAQLSQLALEGLRTGPFKVSYNEPFKGGYLTRYWGKPEDRVHGLQLEMAQDIYLDESNNELDQTKLQVLQPMLLNTLTKLGDHLLKMT